MKERSFDEMIAYFNRRVSEMDVAQDYKMELLGMVTALGFKHEKSSQPEQRWIPIEKEKPRGAEHVLVTLYWADDDWYEVCEMDYGVLKADGNNLINNVIAWMPMPEPYKKEKHND